MGDHRKGGVVAAAVEVVEAEHREPGRSRQSGLAHAGGTGQHDDASHDRTGEHRVIVSLRRVVLTSAPDRSGTLRGFSCEAERGFLILLAWAPGAATTRVTRPPTQ